MLLPLELKKSPTTTLVSRGSGYEYEHDDGDKMPEFNAETARLRPKPEELSIMLASK
jgi:hypothetical protein